MFDRLFTDELMLVFAGLTWIIMAFVMILLISWHDIEWIWVFAFLVPQTFLLISYFIVWQIPESPASIFPFVAVFGRPGIFGIWVIVLFFCFYRLRQKLHTRRLL